MKKIIVFYLLFSTLAISCVPKSDYDDLKRENDQLIKELDELREEKIKEQESLDLHYTEERALKLIEDYYDFYNANKVYRNPRVRKVSNNKFVISLEETSKAFSSAHSNFWTARVFTLTINRNGTYNIE